MRSENSNKIIWTRARSEGKAKSEPLLIGRKISSEWLKESVPVLEVRLSGNLMNAFNDLQEAGRNIRKKLPVTALRVALIGVIDRVIAIDPDLGLSRSTVSNAMAAMLRPTPEEREDVRHEITRQLKLWMMNTVEPWAEHNGLGEIASRIKPMIQKESVDLVDANRPFLHKSGAPDFGLIARAMGEKLIGEELFQGLGACELVATPDNRRNTIELMTLPTDMGQGDKVYSMVCRLTVCSMPYSHEVYLGVAAMKRVWSNRVPPVAFRMPSRVTGYVMSAGRPAIMVPVERYGGAWEFGDGYASLRAESSDALPENLRHAIDQRSFNRETNWWAGLPELKTLFRRVSPSTVFEADEVALLNGVSSLLDAVLAPRPIQLREVSMVRFQSKLKQEMLRIEDLDGAAGDSLVSEGIPDELDDSEEDVEQYDDTTISRQEKLLRYREQNQKALALVGEAAPRMLWVLGGTHDEQSVIRKSVAALFGGTIEVQTEPLPTGTHGLKADLDLPEGTSRLRFDQRVKRWQDATPAIQNVSKDHPILALICASDKVGNKPEDPVNYYAGIHAFSSIGANVHHVLPMDKPDDPKARQDFLHRTQSALLDVFLAHSGVVFGVKDFLDKLYTPQSIPQSIYGIQVLRSRARVKSGETGVSFMLFTRLIVATGITEIQVVHKGKSGNLRSKWMPLAKGLQWVGTQRALHEGDENWLRNNFADVTRDTLLAIQTADPRAVVMVEWSSVAGLWKGIRDEDLSVGPAKLGEVPLSVFGGLSFVRLRRGSDTMSLRVGSRKTYEGWMDGKGTGEILVDAYYTTSKSLVEVAEEKPENRYSSHYIATMGYAKTVQIKRGFSCYRSMPRVRRLGKKMSEFEQIMLDPGNMDASLPASMDITVMQVPSDVLLENIAMTVMGLRLGYAHYNDWTTLPAPLFFRSKIEDYIIRFPEDEEEIQITTEEEIIDTSISGSQLEMLFSEEELNALQPGGEVIQAPVEEVHEAEIKVSGNEFEPTLEPPAGDLLACARAIKVTNLYAMDGGNRVLYKRMIRDHGHVHVTLPYWVKTPELFGPYTPTIRRMSLRVWDALRELDYVKKSGVPKPKDADLLNWLSAHLRTPQAIHAIMSVTRDIGGVQFMPMTAIIRDEFNVSIENEELHIDPRQVLYREHLATLTTWANEHNHDAFAGWLVFLIAQMGDQELANRVLSSLTRIPGPRTEDALDYYIACAEVINDVLAQGQQSHHLIRHRPLHPAAAVAKVDAVAKPATPQESVAEIPASQEQKVFQQQEEMDLIMAIKNKLVDLIQHLSPGSEDFEAGLAAVNGALEEIASIHRVAVGQKSAHVLLRERFDALRANCEALIAALTAVKENLELGNLTYVEPQESLLETTTSQVAEIQALLDEFSALSHELESLSALPPASAVTERARRNAKESETLKALMSVGNDVKAKLDECNCITVSNDATPPEDKELVPVEITPALDIKPTKPIVDQPAAKIVVAAIEPPVATVIAVEVPAKEKAVEEKIVSPSVGTDLNEIDFHIGTLNELLHQRYYGLAEVHVEALKQLIMNVPDTSISGHQAVLSALVSALYSMDCQFEFENRLNPELQKLLDSGELPSGLLCEPPVAALGILGASLASMLFASPEVQWSIGNAIGSLLQGHHALSELIKHIDDIRRQGLIITRDMYISSHIGEKSAIEVELARFKKRASEWKTGPDIYSNWNHRGFRRLHEEIYGLRHSIGFCLSLIAKGDAARVQSSYEDVRRKLEKPASTIDEAYKKLGERTQPEGLYRDRAIENLEITKRFIESYLDHVRRRENPSVDLNRNVQQFLTGLHTRFTESVKEINAIETNTHLERLYRDAVVVAIKSALNLYENSPPPMCIPQDKQKLLVQLPLNRDLMPTLELIDTKTPALVTPDEVFHETSRWVNEKLRLDDSSESIDAALNDAMRIHIDNKRFMPAWRIAKLINATDSVAQAYNKEIVEFRARLQETKQRVTHAMTLSALQQDEASSMQRIIEKMRSSLSGPFGIGHPDGDSSTFPDFPQSIAALNFNVTMPLKARLNEAATQLNKSLDDYADQHGNEATEDVKRIRAIMADSTNAANLRTAFDAMAMLNANNRLPKRLGQPVDISTIYDDFMVGVHLGVGNNKFPLDSLRDRLKQTPHDGDPIWLGALDTHARQEAVDIINAWTDMFSKSSDKFDVNLLTRVLQMMGVSHVPNVIPEPGRQNRVKFFLNNRAFTFPNTHEDDAFIPPVLGSWATHIEGFVVNGMPQENDLRQLLIGMAGTPTLVLCRNHFNMQKRARICGNSPVLLIDDDLIAYLALQPADRLQNLMRIAILTFATNPYDDYGGRPVPTEMFFGRQKELSKLRDVKSVGVLYGGRRLGKSSLLAQIVQESQKIPGSAAVYISMDTVPSSPDYLDSAWEYLYFALVKQNVIQARGTSKPGDHKEIKAWVEKEITGRVDLKSLYLLIDEADTMMGCELRYANGENSFVKQLVHLIDSVHTCRVRYVIAGLHNMTRMATEENSVFGKVEPIALEPFNTADDFQRGISLITKPMAAMGFLFAPNKQDLPLRILSVCNFYPAFIQLYCKRLVDRLQNNRQSGKPPVYITEQDLDAVENDDTLLSELRGKFELNLNLDKRYKAIALILADVYYSDVEKGQYSGLTVPEIREYCESFCGEHFAHTGAGAYEALLDEMVKLNVLERAQGSRYQLRNPNIAMMMGDRERVSSKLDELAKEKSSESRNHGERRIAMTCQSNTMLFQLPIGWVRSQTNTLEDGELFVLTTSKMSGLEEAVSNLGRDDWALGHSVVVSAMLGSGPDAANEFLSKMRRGGQSTAMRRLMLVRTNAWTLRQISEFANVASRASRFGIRIALVSPPERSFELSQAIDDGILKPGMVDAQRGWSIVPVPIWSEDAIFFQMSENVAVSQDSAAIHAIQEATCGFGSAVTKLCSSSLSVQDALNAPEVFGAKFAGSLKDLYDHVGIPAAFTDKRRREMETFLAFLDGTERNTFESDALRKECGVTQGEMDFMYWMGLLQGGPKGTWRVPTLYRNLINQ